MILKNKILTLGITFSLLFLFNNVMVFADLLEKNTHMKIYEFKNTDSHLNTVSNSNLLKVNIKFKMDDRGTQIYDWTVYGSGNSDLQDFVDEQNQIGASYAVVELKNNLGSYKLKFWERLTQHFILKMGEFGFKTKKIIIFSNGKSEVFSTSSNYEINIEVVASEAQSESNVFQKFIEFILSPIAILTKI
jgi:hypothetical protein